MNWIIMPVLAGPEMTEAAISDCCAMADTQLLVVNQGVDDEFRDRLERMAEQIDDVHIWHHNPPLSSLGASWNRALDFVWAAGGTEALVVNNDVRLHVRTYELLVGCLNVENALFVTGVADHTYNADAEHPLYWYDEAKRKVIAKGGPDFSCYMISRGCHERYRFDENFIPAYCEDLDYHRRLMLAGESSRIFSAGVPYLHLAAGTLKQVDPQRKMKIETQIGQGSRAYYAKKWGGPVNQERFWVPFGGGFAETDNKPPAGFDCGPSTPEIQAWCQAADRGVVPPESAVRKTPPPYEGLKQHVMLPHERETI